MPSNRSAAARAWEQTGRHLVAARAIGAQTRERRAACLECFPITWNHVIDKESLKIKTLEQVLFEKVCQLFRNLL
ncbi:MAG: hypothetical protein FJX40_15295 [Alphaproteobacteria bacterium]|nr:hypothetical protein [Alphaproteobacteria bacterium]MBM3641752.1 hypothetical protein [Alphaproteobacteria bacterium]